MSPQEQQAYPLDYLDKAALIAMNLERRCSAAIIWEYRVRGSIDPEACRQALRDTLTRFPICRSTIKPLHPRRELRSLAYVVDPDYDLGDLFTYTNLEGQGPDALAALQREIRNRQVDPFKTYPFHLNLTRVSSDECWLSFYQHHCICDARGFTTLASEFAEFLRCAEEGRRPTPAQLEPYPKQDELTPLGISRFRAFLWSWAGIGISIRRAYANRRNPIQPSFHNEGTDYASGDLRAFWVKLDSKQLADWKPLRNRHGIGLTALLAAAQFEADRRWNLELGRKTGRTVMSMVAETRPRDGSFRSFANHFGDLYAELDLSQEMDLLEMMRSIHDQIVRAVERNEHKKRLLFEREITRALPIESLRSLVHDGTPWMNLRYSNVIAIPFRNLDGRGWCADEMFITTATAKPFGVMVSMVEYNGQVNVNFNYKTSVVPPAQVERLAQHFENALNDLIRALAA